MIFLTGLSSNKYNKIWYPQVHDPYIHISGPLLLCISTLIKKTFAKIRKNTEGRGIILSQFLMLKLNSVFSQTVT